eukprot:gene13652-13774_t
MSDLCPLKDDLIKRATVERLTQEQGAIWDKGEESLQRVPLQADKCCFIERQNDLDAGFAAVPLEDLPVTRQLFVRVRNHHSAWDQI